MKTLASLLLFIFSLYAYAELYTLSVCAIFQNEAEYLNEWVEYHHKQGVEHFWLYNNNSTDDYQIILKPWIDQGIVQLIEWPSTPEENDWSHFTFGTQIGAYNDSLHRARNVSKWLALIDTDEFIVPVSHESIPDLLETRYSDASGLCINWQCYGTSGVYKANTGHLLQSLTHKMRWDHEWNKNSKCIVQPLHVYECINPHYCIYTSGHWAIDARGNRTDGCCRDISIDIVRLNHYWTRDGWFLENVKIPRYQRWGNNIDAVKLHAESMNEEFDPIIYLN